MSDDAEKVVREFCGAFERMDVDELLGFLAPDVVYHNIPMDPAVGHDGFRALFQLFGGMAQRIEAEIHHVAVVGDVVLTERTDRFQIGDKTAELRVMGAFEVHSGLITAKRDYFDLQQFLSQIS